MAADYTRFLGHDGAFLDHDFLVMVSTAPRKETILGLVCRCIQLILRKRSSVLKYRCQNVGY